MTPQQQIENQSLAGRMRKAAEFIENPALFQVCENCSSIGSISRGICQFCGGYRFNSDPEKVVEVAKVIGATPFPQGGANGTLPRF
jgi:hypothetical protein